MIIGVPKEIKNSEFRVGLTDENVRELVTLGHKLLVQKSAGEGVGISDTDYQKAGASLLDRLDEVYQESEMIVKVKEPLAQEYDFFQEGQILFTFLHLAPEPELSQALCQKKVSAMAYETIEDAQGQLPLLKPMSEIAGRVGLLNGVYYLQKFAGGKGILPGGIAGSKKAQVTILGGGTAGMHSALSAVGLEAKVTILDVNPQRLKELDHFFKGRVECQLSKDVQPSDPHAQPSDPHARPSDRHARPSDSHVRPSDRHARESGHPAKLSTDAQPSVDCQLSNKESIDAILQKTDILIASVLITGHKAPKIISRKQIQLLPSKSVVVDISIDQGGCIETARATSHTKPIYIEEDIIHYCVPNIPSAVARTSTFALTSKSFPYIKELGAKGLKKALKDPGFKKGLNSYQGYITYEPVARALGREYRQAGELGL